MSMIGHNQPPLAERLALDYAELTALATETLALVPADLRPIASDEEAAAATETAAEIKRVIDQADKAHKAEKQPWLDGGRTVDGFFRFRDGLTAAAKRVTTAIDRHLTEKRRAAQAEQAALEKREREAAAMFGGDEPAAATPIAPEATRVVSFSGAMAAGSVRWDFRVTDAAKVPREYLMVNEPAIRAALAGLKAQGKKVEEVQIPGVEAFEAVRAAIRR